MDATFYLELPYCTEHGSDEPTDKVGLRVDIRKRGRSVRANPDPLRSGIQCDPGIMHKYAAASGHSNDKI